MQNGKWIDISVPIKNGMVHWPGDPQVSISRLKDMNNNDQANLSYLSLGAHTGTHMDAPLHFFKDGSSIKELDPDFMIGPARVIHIRDEESIKVSELAEHDIGHGERILFRTVNSLKAWQSDEFYKDFVYICPEAADFLAERGPALIGVDYLSVGGYYSGGAETHRKILGAGIWVIEGLDLSNVEEGEYELACLPLKIVDSDGAPARAVVRRRS